MSSICLDVPVRRHPPAASFLATLGLAWPSAAADGSVGAQGAPNPRTPDPRADR
jgi:hypothetical protein